MEFLDRADAGRQLADRLADQLTRSGDLAGADVVVVGLPRGGVPVAFEVARALGAPLDVIVVRKLGVPVQPELAMGAVGEGGTRVLDDDVLRGARVTEAELRAGEAAARHELETRALTFRAVRPRVDLAGRIVVIVDDGMATGSTARAACQVARAAGAARIVLAVPVAPADAAARLGPDADEVVVVTSQPRFHAVGQAYVDFRQVTDHEVVELLERSRDAER